MNGEGKIKSTRDFQRMGLNEVEIIKLHQLFKNIPVIWNGLLKKKTPADSWLDTDLNLGFIFNGRVKTMMDVTSKKQYIRPY